MKDSGPATAFLERREAVVLLWGVVAFLLWLNLLRQIPFGDLGWFYELGEQVAAGRVALFGDLTWSLFGGPPVSFVHGTVVSVLADFLGMEAYQAGATLLSLVILGVSLWAQRLIRAFGLNRTEARWFAFALFAALMLAPSLQHGTRDHIFVVLALPLLLLGAFDSQRSALPPGERLAAGLLAGIGVCFKWSLALVIILLAVVQAIRTRSVLSLFRLEFLAAAFVTIAAFALCLALNPETRAESLAALLEQAEAYRGVMQSDANFRPDSMSLGSIAALLGVGLVAWRLDPARRRILFGLILLSLVSLAGALLQQKTIYYHRVPSVVFAITAGLMALLFVLRGLSPRRSRALVAIGLVLALSLPAITGVNLLRLSYRSWLTPPITAFPNLAASPTQAALVDLLEDHGGKEILALSTEGNQHFIAINLTEVHGTFPLFDHHLLKALYQEGEAFRAPEEMGTVERNLWRKTLDYVSERRPGLIAAQINKEGAPAFDLLAYFNRAPAFNNVFSAMVPIGEAGGFQFYAVTP